MAGTYSVLSSWAYKSIFNTTGGERDTYQVPFCEWLYTVNVPALTTTDCAAIDNVVCDSDGNVVELQLAQEALLGELPASFSAFTKLRKLYLSYNRLSGQLPAQIFTSGDLETINVASNYFTGSVTASLPLALCTPWSLGTSTPLAVLAPSAAPLHLRPSAFPRCG